jgi:hypothetical protein
MMAMEAVIDFVRGSGLQNLRVRVAQSGDRVVLAGFIPLGTGSIIGAFMMVLEYGHVIKTVNHMEVSGMVVVIMRNVHLEFFLPFCVRVCLLSLRYGAFRRGDTKSFN